jgi:hypothetical protein
MGGSDSLLEDGDSMPYDMSAVEEMERITQQAQQHAEVSVEHVRSKAITLDEAPQLNDAMTDEEQSFFSEKDVDSFLEQRAHAEAELAAKAEATARAHAEAEAAHQLALEAEAKHAALVAAQEKAHQLQMIKDTQAHAIEAANRAFDSHAAVSQSEQASEFQAGLQQLEQHKLEDGQEQEFDLDLDATNEVQGESEVESEDVMDSEAAEQNAAFVEGASKRSTVRSTKPLTEVDQMRARREHFAEVEQAGLKALARAEFLAKVKQHYTTDAPVALAETEQQVKKQSTKPTTFLEARARSRSSSAASQPWWASQQGVTSNYHHYQQGVKNSLLANSNGQVPNAANSYVLPLGKAVSASRLNQKKVPARAIGPVQAYPLIPVQQQGKSLAFNPYSGADFHPEIAVPAHAPKLPTYMAESTQPWAGAGYYGSGGGQGPHPGSEAFVPLPGVSGKEFGIRAREAWEHHTEQFGQNPTAFHDVKNLPEYPYFPSWSRESEIGGRPDLFPKPMFNLPTVNAIAQQAGKAAYAHSQVYYPHLNNPITTPEPFVQAARQQAAGPIAGIRRPRLIRQVIGYPRPTAPTSWAGTIPEQFPQPRNSNSFEEVHNYADVNRVPVLGVPYHPLAGRNIMVNSGPDKGMHPIYGGFPQYIPVPVAAQAQSDVVATQ